MWKDAIRHAKILIVADNAHDLFALETILQDGGYSHIVSTTDARQTPALYRQLRPDAVVLDLHMPSVDSFSVIHQLEELLPRGSHLPLLAMSDEVCLENRRRALQAGADDFLFKPFDGPEVLLRLQNLLRMHWAHGQLRHQKQILEERVRSRTLELERAEREMLERLAIAAEYRDDDTGRHTKRVSRTAALLAGALGLPAVQIELIHQAAPLHDIGKIGIADGILLKTGPLTPEEINTMRTHTVIGAKILSGSRSPMLQLAEQIALSHHERWDGSGYPFRLQAEEIPLSGRIVAVADVFDALTTERPYKMAWSREKAVAEIERLSGSHFDPRLVSVFSALPHEQLIESLPPDAG
jgi:putative two-component system response regulator